MAHSEKAKELQRKQRAQIKAERERKRNSDDPRDWGTIRQLRETYKMTAEIETSTPWLLGASFIVVLGVVLCLSLLVSTSWLNIVFGVIFGALLGLLASMWLLVWRAKKAAYTRTAGQLGSTRVGLSSLSKKWSVSDPIAANKSQDIVYRAVGPGGIVLIGEGEPGRLKALLASEVKKHQSVAYEVKVTAIQAGDKAGQVSASKLAGEIKKLPKVMTELDIDQVNQRLRALDAMRIKAPIPQGPLATRGSRQAMRGR